jgi:peptidoglycan/LPS O-acetylase OafA/YrhL
MKPILGHGVIYLLLTVGAFLLLFLMGLAPNRLKAFGERRRRIAMGIVVLGLCSFFVPLIGTDPAVLGRVRWSPLDVLLQLHAGTLSIPAGTGPIWMNPVVAYLSAAYLLLFATLLALAVNASPKLVVGFAASVPLFSVVTNWGSPFDELTSSLASLFYRSGSGHVDFSSYATVQLVIAMGLLATLYLENLD